ncbi:MAG: YbaB/EbfC family nucleoid-associated protein [Firmicutes bacterium]|nr:YbaB/EbfC family nucleoid-associated protein [Bacillota bacterium]
MKVRLPFGGKNANDMAKKMQNMQEKLKEIEEKQYEGRAGGGAVKALVSGKIKLLSINIDSEVINVEEKDILEDLIVAATNQALEEAFEEKEKISQEVIDFGF